MSHKLLSALVLTVGLVAGTARAQAPTANPEEVIEGVVVRERLYSTGGRLEVSPTIGFTVLNRLTDHQNLNLGIAYNVTDTIAFEARGGYALSRHTGLANNIAANLLRRDPARELGLVDDLAELWEMQANAAIGIRWNPIYGKISLLADVPVHFQTYIWAGGGFGTFKRESIVECLQVESRGDGLCAQYNTVNRAGPLASVALGFRFFTHQGGAVRVEVRDYAFTDSFKQKIDRRASEGGNETGEDVASPGFINLVLFDLGYVFLF